MDNEQIAYTKFLGESFFAMLVLSDRFGSGSTTLHVQTLDRFSLRVKS